MADNRTTDPVVEAIARRISARKLMLLTDRLGEKLPESLWLPYVPKAVQLLDLFFNAVDTFVEERK